MQINEFASEDIDDTDQESNPKSGEIFTSKTKSDEELALQIAGNGITPGGGGDNVSKKENNEHIVSRETSNYLDEGMYEEPNNQTKGALPQETQRRPKKLPEKSPVPSEPSIPDDNLERDESATLIDEFLENKLVEDLVLDIEEQEAPPPPLPPNQMQQESESDDGIVVEKVTKG